MHRAPDGHTIAGVAYPNVANKIVRTEKTDDVIVWDFGRPLTFEGLRLPGPLTLRFGFRTLPLQAGAGRTVGVQWRAQRLAGAALEGALDVALTFAPGQSWFDVELPLDVEGVVHELSLTFLPPPNADNPRLALPRPHARYANSLDRPEEDRRARPPRRRRPDVAVQTSAFDGRTIPFADGAFDVVVMVDVLHHALDCEGLLAEAARVADAFVLIKDHYRDGFASNVTLRFMDWVGNRAHGVVLPYRHVAAAEWAELFRRRELEVESLRGRLGLYPPPSAWIFERSLHFVAKLRHAQSTQLDVT